MLILKLNVIFELELIIDFFIIANSHATKYFSSFLLKRHITNFTYHHTVIKRAHRLLNFRLLNFHVVVNISHHKCHFKISNNFIKERKCKKAFCFS
jgi:DeoR/GlpR family transcriptional regulator of sugar metabolism